MPKTEILDCAIPFGVGLPMGLVMVACFGTVWSVRKVGISTTTFDCVTHRVGGCGLKIFYLGFQMPLCLQSWGRPIKFVDICHRRALRAHTSFKRTHRLDKSRQAIQKGINGISAEAGFTKNRPIFWDTGTFFLLSTVPMTPQMDSFDSDEWNS